MEKPWWDKLDELEAKGYRLDERLHLPDGTACGLYPEHWTQEQAVNRAYEWVGLVESGCPRNQWLAQ